MQAGQLIPAGRTDFKNGILHMEVTNEDGTVDWLPVLQQPVQVLGNADDDHTVKKLETEDDINSAVEEEMIRRLETHTGEVIYDSATAKSDCYYQTTWLWCACCEPRHSVTTNFVKSKRWSGCGKTVDTMAIDVVFDAGLEQDLCQHCCNYCGWCGMCCEDVGTVVLYGSDKTHNEGVWRLERIHGATQVHEDLTLWLQYYHKDFRHQIKNRIEQVGEIKRGHRGDAQ